MERKVDPTNRIKSNGLPAPKQPQPPCLAAAPRSCVVVALSLAPPARSRTAAAGASCPPPAPIIYRGGAQLFGRRARRPRIPSSASQAPAGVGGDRGAVDRRTLGVERGIRWGRRVPWFKQGGRRSSSLVDAAGRESRAHRRPPAHPSDPRPTNQTTNRRSSGARDWPSLDGGTAAGARACGARDAAGAWAGAVAAAEAAVQQEQHKGRSCAAAAEGASIGASVGWVCGDRRGVGACAAWAPTCVCPGAFARNDRFTPPRHLMGSVPWRVVDVDVGDDRHTRTHKTPAHQPNQLIRRASI